MQLVNMVNNFIKAANVRHAAPKQNVSVAGNNPFAGPLIKSQNSPQHYAQNRPVNGGFFAGYHNGKANYVGRKLFIEV